MGRNKRELRVKVQGQKRKKPDIRRIARTIVRLAVEQGTEEAQALADALEHEEALQRTAIRRQRAADRAEGEAATEERRAS